MTEREHDSGTSGGASLSERMPGSRTGSRRVLRWVTIGAVVMAVLAAILFSAAGTPASGLHFFGMIFAGAAAVLLIWTIIGWIFELTDRRRR